MTSDNKPINSQSHKARTSDVSLTSDVRCRCHVAGNPKHSSGRSCSSRLPSYIVVALQLTSECQHDIEHLTAGNIAKALSLHPPTPRPSHSIKVVKLLMLSLKSKHIPRIIPVHNLYNCILYLDWVHNPNTFYHCTVLYVPSKWRHYALVSCW